MYTPHDFPAAHVHDFTAVHVFAAALVYCTCFFASKHVYHTYRAVLIDSSSCHSTSHSSLAKLWYCSKYLKKQVNPRIYLIRSNIIFFVKCSTALTSWLFCVDQFFWAIAIRAVEHHPIISQKYLPMKFKSVSSYFFSRLFFLSYTFFIWSGFFHIGLGQLTNKQYWHSTPYTYLDSKS
jgi:hypothetical protein